jgi:hypothetical protein
VTFVLFISVIMLICTFSIGPVDLTQGTLTGSSALVPTVTDNLFKQGTISTEVIGIYYAPTTTGSFDLLESERFFFFADARLLISESNTNGELTFGGT